MKFTLSIVTNRTGKWSPIIALFIVIAVICYWSLHTESPQALLVKTNATTRSTKTSVERQKNLNPRRQRLSGRSFGETNMASSEDFSEIMLAAPLLGEIQTQGKYLDLSEDQQALLIDDYITYTRVRSEIETKQILVRSFDGQKLVLEIPPYPNLGKALRKSFYDQLRSDFSPEVMKRIDNVFGSFFTVQFKGYGQMAQSFEVSRSSIDPNGYRVVWAARPPEDIGGERAEAILGGYAGSSGQTTLNANELLAGNYEFLRNIIVEKLQ